MNIDVNEPAGRTHDISFQTRTSGLQIAATILFARNNTIGLPVGGRVAFVTRKNPMGLLQVPVGYAGKQMMRELQIVTMHIDEHPFPPGGKAIARHQGSSSSLPNRPQCSDTSDSQPMI